MITFKNFVMMVMGALRHVENGPLATAGLAIASNQTLRNIQQSLKIFVVSLLIVLMIVLGLVMLRLVQWSI